LGQTRIEIQSGLTESKKQFFVHLASYSGPVLEPFLLQKKESKIEPFWSWFRIATFLVDAQTFPESTLKL
jgi:hypothetical protein